MNEGITVTGNGRASAAPDVVCLSLGTEARARDVQRALDDARTGLVSMRQTLIATGVEERDLRTTETSLWSEGRPTLEHVARLGLEVNVRDVGTAGELMSKALRAAGDTARMHGVHFSYSEPEALAAEARERAWDDASAKASQLASLAGRSLGEVVSVTESEPSWGPRPMAVRAAFAADEAAPIDAGEQAVTASVTVTWAWGR